MQAIRSWYQTAWVIGCIALFALSGCAKSGPKSGNLKGDVTYQGKPLTTGSISFHPDSGGEPVMTAIGIGGNYQINELPIGLYKVTVKTPPAPPMGSPKGKAFVPPRFANPTPIPATFADPAKSGLTVEVKEGNVPYNIELK